MDIETRLDVCIQWKQWSWEILKLSIPFLVRSHLSVELPRCTSAH